MAKYPYWWKYHHEIMIKITRLQPSKDSPKRKVCNQDDGSQMIFQLSTFGVAKCPNLEDSQINPAKWHLSWNHPGNHFTSPRKSPFPQASPVTRSPSPCCCAPPPAPAGTTWCRCRGGPGRWPHSGRPRGRARAPAPRRCSTRRTSKGSSSDSASQRWVKNCEKRGKNVHRRWKNNEQWWKTRAKNSGG